jgi:beta-glucosidase/6-phospho-beta-glucosidase/beta-galactosidase
MRVLTQPEAFLWASGIEDTFVPQTRPGHRALDEYELMGHYEHWREDLALARELGVQAIRWGVPWYRVEPEQGRFEWGWIDEVLPYIVEELGITPIVDLMHYGCPLWLRREFANPDYPRAVSAYAAEFARRYGHLVRWYTPLNEPIVNALMCGRRGLWPPYLRGDRGYIRVMLQLAKGIQQTVAAIKAVDPDAIMVHVEATGLSRAIREELEVLALEDQHRGYLCYDLISGRVTPAHSLFGWLVRSGAGITELAEVAQSQIPIDIMGMNFYPQWSTQQIDVDPSGRLRYSNASEEGGGVGFHALIEDYYERYRAPIMVTETSAYGADAVRARWLETSVAVVKDLRAEGIPVIGYTWFPMFTMIDWKYRWGRRPVDRYRIELGLWTLGSGGGPRWRPTPLVEQLKEYVRGSAATVGELAGERRRHTRPPVGDDGVVVQEPIPESVAMRPEAQTLPDGRYLLFYRFENGAKDV